jgi:serpin B
VRWAAACVIVLCGRRPAATPPVDARSAEGAATASNRLGFDLCDQLRDEPGGDPDNLIFSPASAEVALAMASAGARGEALDETLDEMARVLHADRLGEAHASFGNLLRSLNGRDGQDGLTIHLADRLCGQTGLVFRPEFLSIMSDQYSAPLALVDYVRASEAARIAINTWAAEETHDRIQDLLAPGSVSSDTRLVLANAVYFKGAWRFPFETSATADEDFKTASAKTKVRMMRQLGWFDYADVGGARVIELPYRGGFTMVVVLPDDVEGLASVERRVNGEYEAWIAKMKKREVDLKLPQWKTTSTFEVADALEHLGMKRAFGGADFSGMSASPLAIARVVQKVFVESNERGTEAAVTAVGFQEEDSDGERTCVRDPRSGIEHDSPPPPPPAVFHADHPFLYFIRDPSTGVVLFIGRETAPR